MSDRKTIETIVGMALSRQDDDGDWYGTGFVRDGKTPEALAAIDAAIAEGLIEPITIYARTEAGEKLLKRLSR